MNPRTSPFLRVRTMAPSRRGSVLIIVLWVAFGLVSLAVYFGHSMIFEYRAADQNVAGVEADQAIEGAARYISYVLTNTTTAPGQLPLTNTYRSAAVAVGDATFWLIGREDSDQVRTTPVYGLVDEGSKLNLNTATLDMLEALPLMTPALAASIIDWRDTNSEVTDGGAESETYATRNPAYQCKNANFETVEELRMVAGATPEILFGEDANLNGVQDPNENDGTISLPVDNRDGKLDPGILEYLTVCTRIPNVRTNGEPRINVNTTGGTNLTARLQELFGADRGRVIQQALQPQSPPPRQGSPPPPPATPYRSLLDIYYRSGMTADEFGKIADDLTVTNATVIEGLVNVNTAPAAVLACIPGIGTDKAAQLVAYRHTQATGLTNMVWVTQVLDRTNAVSASAYLTTQCYQCSADIVAVGHEGRGYRRVRVLFDTSETEPKVIYRRDLTRLGWALGAERPLVWATGKELR